MRKILLIDDDHTMTTLLASLLAQHNFEVVVAANAADAMKRLDSAITLMLLDINLPDEDGFSFLRKLRDHGDRRPILMFTGRDDDQDRIRALTIGADGYITKPFNYLVVAAQLEAALRRATWSAPTAPTGDGLDRDQRVLRLKGRTIPLTLTEYRLLEVLTARAGRVFPRGELWELVDTEGNMDSFDRAIDLHISRLRSKIEVDPKEPRHLLTVRGVGYKFDW